VRVGRASLGHLRVGHLRVGCVRVGRASLGCVSLGHASLGRPSVGRASSAARRGSRLHESAERSRIARAAPAVVARGPRKGCRGAR